ncbi:MAG: polyphosphate kinase 2, partial [Candidatus Aminicenantes bacterium]|nr:polyphosphate kinase 2 [Candidatus Aminicenantes bacterium]NIN88736.1 polyphosphate kinase 2 [Candidatus Aminicenantes bacterium]NIR07807.1 polyphosphate kinase 2 [Candidatus Aminicenantes bacterium]NIT27163.1 polyphosphate kinase 2 [Candidatus Aminicenantes bacterium]
TDTKQVPWYVVNADNKKKARLNCISHILSKIPYKKMEYKPIKLPPLPEYEGYVRPP